MNLHNEEPITITHSEFVELGAQVIKEVCGEPDPKNPFTATTALICGVVLGTLEHKLFDKEE